MCQTGRNNKDTHRDKCFVLAVSDSSLFLILSPCFLLNLFIIPESFVSLIPFPLFVSVPSPTFSPITSSFSPLSTARPLPLLSFPSVCVSSLLIYFPCVSLLCSLSFPPPSFSHICFPVRVFFTTAMLTRNCQWLQVH